jgi:hypothetical protein
LRFVEGRSISTELMDDQEHPFTSSSVRWVVRLPVATTNTTDRGGGGGGHNDNDDQPRSEKKRRVDPHQGTSSSSPIDVNSDDDNDDSDETRGGAGGRLVFSYDRKLSVRNGSPNAWHERLAVRAVMPDHHQQLKGLGAGEEHELCVSQRIDNAGLRGHQSHAKLADIGRLLGLRPTAATTASSSSLASHTLEKEEARFDEEVANLLVMVAKVAMWDAHVTLPPPCAVNQELADHLNCIAEAEMDPHGADSADQLPPPLPLQPPPAAAAAPVSSAATAADLAAMAAAPAPSAQVTASVQFVEDYLREPWPVS